MRTSAKQAVLSGAGAALTLSLLAHASVALFAVHQSRLSVTVHALAPARLDFPTPDQIEVVEVVEMPQAVEPRSSPVAVVRVARAAPAQRELTPLPAPIATGTAAETAVPLIEALASEPSPAPRFAITVAPSIGVAREANVLSSALGTASGTGLAGPIPAAAAEVPAKLRSGAAPAYTAAALSAGVEANVLLEIVVSDNGAVSSARPLQHVGYGLDEAALRSVLAYRFTPALRAGKPVAVRMQWLMRFQLS